MLWLNPIPKPFRFIAEHLRKTDILFSHLQTPIAEAIKAKEAMVVKFLKKQTPRKLKKTFAVVVCVLFYGRKDLEAVAPGLCNSVFAFLLQHLHEVPEDQKARCAPEFLGLCFLNQEGAVKTVETMVARASGFVGCEPSELSRELKIVVSEYHKERVSHALLGSILSSLELCELFKEVLPELLANTEVVRKFAVRFMENPSADYLPYLEALIEQVPHDVPAGHLIAGALLTVKENERAAELLIRCCLSQRKEEQAAFAIAILLGLCERAKKKAVPGLEALKRKLNEILGDARHPCLVVSFPFWEAVCFLAPDLAVSTLLRGALRKEDGSNSVRKKGSLLVLAGAVFCSGVEREACMNIVDVLAPAFRKSAQEVVGKMLASLSLEEREGEMGSRLITHGAHFTSGANLLASDEDLWVGDPLSEPPPREEEEPEVEYWGMGSAIEMGGISVEDPSEAEEP